MKNLKNKLLMAVMTAAPISCMSPEIITAPSVHKAQFQFDAIPKLDNKLMDKAYAMAPTGIHNLVHAFKTTLPSGAYRRPLLFTGLPGTGKTTLAQAIVTILNKPLKNILELEGYESTAIQERLDTFKEQQVNYEYKYTNASQFGNEYQHSKARALKKVAQDIVSTQKECVWVIDEAHALFSGQKNEHSTQAHETALVLKNIFERLKKTNKVLIICTTNYPEQIPQEYGLRSWFLYGNVLHFAQPDRDKQLLAMEYHLQKNKNVAVALSKEELIKFVPQVDGWSFRRLAALCNESVQNALIQNSNNAAIQVKHLQEAFNNLQERYKSIAFNHEELSEQERFCNETLELQEKNHNAQLRHTQLSMEYNNNLHNLHMVMNLRGHNTGNTKGSATYYDPGLNHGYWVGGNHYSGWDLRGVLPGDSKKVLPESIQTYVNNKKPAPSLYMQHREEIDSSIREERLKKEKEEQEAQEREEKLRKEEALKRERAVQEWRRQQDQCVLN